MDETEDRYLVTFVDRERVPNRRVAELSQVRALHRHNHVNTVTDLRRRRLLRREEWQR